MDTVNGIEVPPGALVYVYQSREPYYISIAKYSAAGHSLILVLWPDGPVRYADRTFFRGEIKWTLPDPPEPVRT